MLYTVILSDRRDVRTRKASILQVSVSDRMEITDRRRTGDGFLATTGRISRTGNYTYSRNELQLDGDPNAPVQIFRPEDAVFSDESMASAAHRPLTLNHPPAFVDASNWKKYSVGHAGGKVRRDGEFLDVDMLIMDGAAIDAVEHGAPLSPGYTAEIDMTPGVSPTGEHYDGIMKGPYKFNHIAVLTGPARGGPQCRLGDAWPAEISDTKTPTKERKNMPSLILDGLKVDLSDEEAVSAAFKKLSDKATAAEAAAATAIADKANAEAAVAAAATANVTAIEAKDAEVATLTATVATLNSELADARDPAKLRDAAAAYGVTVTKAKALGATVADNASEADVKAAAVKLKLGDVAANWTPAQIDVSFATLTANVTDAAPTDPFRDAMANRNVVDFPDAATKAADARKAMIDGFNKPRADAK